MNDTQNVRLLGWCRYINLLSELNGTSSLKIYKEQLQLAKAKCAGNVTNLPKVVEKIALCYDYLGAYFQGRNKSIQFSEKSTILATWKQILSQSDDYHQPNEAIPGNATCREIPLKERHDIHKCTLGSLVINSG